MIDKTILTKKSNKENVIYNIGIKYIIKSSKFLFFFVRESSYFLSIDFNSIYIVSLLSNVLIVDLILNFPGPGTKDLRPQTRRLDIIHSMAI